MNKEEIDFDNYQNHVKSTDTTTDKEVLIYGLVGEVGEILTAFKKHKLNEYPNFKDELKEELGDVLWYLSAIAYNNGLQLKNIAKSNKEKSQLLFGGNGKVYHFDKNFPEDEQLLRQFDIDFIVGGDNRGVKMKMDNCFIGDPITDNSHHDDGYRYHDAFHLAYATVLGWSPVVRKMLKRKRKSNPRIDEVEDGARAAIIEEAISIFIFNDAKDKNYYRNNQESNINSRTMKIILLMVKGLEVEQCTAKDWKKAILLGYDMFNNLRENKGGKLHIDLDERQITFEK